jgi:hypothetical protein
MNDANQSYDWISGLLDGRQESDVRGRDLSSDRRVAREAEIIGALRSTLQNRRTTLRTQVPASLERSIRMAIAEEAFGNQRPSLGDRFRQAWSSLAARPALAGLTLAGIAAVAFMSVFVLRSTPSLPTDLTEAAFAIYGQVTSSDEAVELRSSDRDGLRKFFAERGVTFNVFFPDVDAELIGGSVRTINGQEFPVLVFAAAGHRISLLEVDEASIGERTVTVDTQTSDDVAQSRWHWASANNKTLFVWKSNSVMCSVVSDLAVDEVSALFRLEAL